MPTEKDYWEAVQSKLCIRCVDGDSLGGCRLPARADCAIKVHFPHILDAVNSVYSSSIDPYEEQLRNKVCRFCINRSADGSCRLRNNLECALDRYFPLLVQILEETQLRKRLRTV
ncbi:MAG: hypothetical protein AB1428_01650 [Bacteroidota bacterium]